MTLLERAIELAQQQGLKLEGTKIVSQGKFEREHVATVFFYDLFLNGFADESIGNIDTFLLTDEEKAELETDKDWFVLHHLDNGFVAGTFSSGRQVQHYKELECLEDSEGMEA
jgi:hypothetical protein